MLGKVAAVRGDAVEVRKHYEAAMKLDRGAIMWFNYSTSLGVLDEHEAALEVARKGLAIHADDVGLVERVVEAAMESGNFGVAGEFCRRRERLLPGRARWRDQIDAVQAAIDSGWMTEAGARGLIRAMTEVQRSEGVRTVVAEIIAHGDTFLYDRGVRCTPAVASSMNWRLTQIVVDRSDLSVDPGRTLIGGFYGVWDGGNP